MAIVNAHNPWDIAKAFRLYSKGLTPLNMAWAMEKFAEYKLEKTPEFWEEIWPTVKQQMLTVDRDCSKAIWRITVAVGKMQI